MTRLASPQQPVRPGAEGDRWGDQPATFIAPSAVSGVISMISRAACSVVDRTIGSAPPWSLVVSGFSRLRLGSLARRRLGRPLEAVGRSGVPAGMELHVGDRGAWSPYGGRQESHGARGLGGAKRPPGIRARAGAREGHFSVWACRGLQLLVRGAVGTRVFIFGATVDDPLGIRLTACPLQPGPLTGARLSGSSSQIAKCDAHFGRLGLLQQRRRAGHGGLPILWYCGPFSNRPMAQS